MEGPVQRETQQPRGPGALEEQMGLTQRQRISHWTATSATCDAERAHHKGYLFI